MDISVFAFKLFKYSSLINSMLNVQNYMMTHFCVVPDAVQVLFTKAVLVCADSIEWIK